MWHARCLCTTFFFVLIFFFLTVSSTSMFMSIASLPSTALRVPDILSTIYWQYIYYIVTLAWSVQRQRHRDSVDVIKLVTTRVQKKLSYIGISHATSDDHFKLAST